MLVTVGIDGISGIMNRTASSHFTIDFGTRLNFDWSILNATREGDKNLAAVIRRAEVLVRMCRIACVDLLKSAGSGSREFQNEIVYCCNDTYSYRGWYTILFETTLFIIPTYIIF